MTTITLLYLLILKSRRSPRNLRVNFEDEEQDEDEEPKKKGKLVWGWNIRTFFETSQCDIRSLHVNLSKEAHMSKAFYNISLPCLWNCVICCHKKAKRSILNIMMPESCWWASSSSASVNQLFCNLQHLPTPQITPIARAHLSFILTTHTSKIFLIIRLQRTLNRTYRTRIDRDIWLLLLAM